MKYKTGDKVRVRKDLEDDKLYGSCNFIDEMNRFLGKIVTIKKVLNNSYCIEDSGYYWTDEMFEGLATFTKSDLKRGDIVTDSEGDISIFDGDELVGETLDLSDLTEDLDDERYPITKVERPIKLETIWERKNELVEMSMAELEEKLGIECGTLRIKKED